MQIELYKFGHKKQRWGWFWKNVGILKYITFYFPWFHISFNYDVTYPTNAGRFTSWTEAQHKEYIRTGRWPFKSFAKQG